MAESISEERALKLLTDKNLKILSIGISTAGEAEVKMAKMNSNRKIVATTIDEKGLEFTKKLVEKEGLFNRIELKLEDVSKPMSYPDNEFDFVYARFVLHYLNKQDLDIALKEIKRVLKKEGKFFVVVRVKESWFKGITTYDPVTCMTTRIKDGKNHSRYYHNNESITKHLTDAGFSIISVENYEEILSPGFERKIMNDNPTPVIEVVAKS